MSPKPEKNVKREVKAEADDDAPISLSLKSKRKPDQTNGTRSKPTPAAKVKKEEDRDYEDDSKPSSRKTPKKLDKDKKLIKKIKVKEEVPKRAKAVVLAAENGKKAKKVYDLPGQKHEPPKERDPLRIFYETLHQQVPKSEMAAFWMMEWGLLPPHEAKKVYEKKLKRNQQQKLSSPTKKAVLVKKATDTRSPVKAANVASKTASKTPKKRKPLDSSSDQDDDDFTPLKKKFRK